MKNEALKVAMMNASLPSPSSMYQEDSKRQDDAQAQQSPGNGTQNIMGIEAMATKKESGNAEEKAAKQRKHDALKPLL